MEFPRAFAPVLSMSLLLLLAGCFEPPERPSDELIDAGGDGFLDVPPPAGVVFDQWSNVRLRMVNEIDSADLADVARTGGVAEELISLLPLASVMVTVDMDLHYAGGPRGAYSYSVRLRPFERKLEFACPQRTEVSLRVDVLLPLGNMEPVFVDTAMLAQETEYVCGDTLELRAWVDDAGVVRIKRTAAGQAALP